MSNRKIYNCLISKIWLEKMNFSGDYNIVLRSRKKLKLKE